MTRFSLEPDAFGVDIEPDRETIVVIPRGELDIATVPELERAVRDLRDAGFGSMRVDLRRLTFIDSCGIRLILQLARDERLTLSVLPGPPAVQRAFEVAGLAGRAPFVPAPRPPAGLEATA